MATVNLIRAAARSRAGKGAARAERRTGRIPGIIYGDGKPPLPISLDFADLRQRIYAGHFLTTLFNVDVDGEKHQVISRGYQLDPLRDQPTHVDFQRVAPGATVRVAVPVKFINQDAAPGIKRGGTLNIVRHTVEFLCPVDAIPDFIVGDLTGLEIGHSLHISAIKLPENVRPVIRDRDFTVATVVSSSGYLEEQLLAKQKEAEAAAAAAAGTLPVEGVEGVEGAEGAVPGATPAEGAAAAPPAADAKGGEKSADKGKK